MNSGNSWPFVRLGYLLKDLQPGFAQRPDPARFNAPQIRTHNVSREGEINMTGVKSVYATDDEIRKFGLKKGDVVFNNTNSPELVGKTAYFDLDDLVVISNHMTRIRVNRDLVDAEYLARYLHYLWLKGKSRDLAKQWVNQAAIDQAALSGFQIPLPPLPEQQRIVSILHNVLLICAANAALRTRWQEISLPRYLKSCL
jgi:type I restriction enzyme, S subunit